jgi:beta-glucosidase
MGGLRNLFLMPSSPLVELKKLAPKAPIEFDPKGESPCTSATRH